MRLIDILTPVQIFEWEAFHNVVIGTLRFDVDPELDPEKKIQSNLAEDRTFDGQRLVWTFLNEYILHVTLVIHVQNIIKRHFPAPALQFVSKSERNVHVRSIPSYDGGSAMFASSYHYVRREGRAWSHDDVGESELRMSLAVSLVI